MNLSDPVSSVPHIGPSYEEKLEKLDIYTVEDLLLHVPRRYLDFRKITNIAQASIGQIVTIQGEIVSAINQYAKSGRQMQIITLYDGTGKMNAIWFNQKYLLSSLKNEEKIAVAGEVQWFGRQKALITPEYEIIKSDKGVHTGRLVPLYPETKGISSKWLRARVTQAFPLVETQFDEFLDSDIRERFGLPVLADAIKSTHFPETSEEVDNGIRRLAFNEFLKLQITGLLRKEQRKAKSQAHEIAISEDDLAGFEESLPFEMTPSQKRSAIEILNDLSKPYPMNRLLEGDVGSGKTVLAAIVCYACHKHDLQCVVMAPTQLLVTQHHQTLSEILAPFGMNVDLVTASTKTVTEDTNVAVGTHALLHGKVSFENVGALVIDEQHRFGVNQQAELKKITEGEGKTPDILTMTATPIPRTVALTAYGDLELSTLDELPKNRKPITTWLVPEKKRTGAYEWIGKEIDTEGVQAFVVCPIIEESESELLQEVTSVTEEYKRIKKIFPTKSVGLLHGRLKAAEKDAIIDTFKEGNIDILVTTPVIEVGIDVPNATIMVIEAADRFGLAQLHQLRGRVGRGSKKSYCLLFSNNTSEKVLSRLEAIKQAKTGFELAELDLSLRGPGELFGTKQSGFPDLHFASWSDTDLIQTTAKFAKEVVENTQKYPDIIQYVTATKDK